MLSSGLYDRAMSGREGEREPVPAEVVAALLGVYRQGAFPMVDPATGEINLYCPDPRAILPIEGEPGEAGGICVSRSLRAAVRRGRVVIRSDTAFERVIRACAEPRVGQEEDGQWLDERMVAMYVELHRAGYAHSVEAWRTVGEGGAGEGEGELVGGLYGVHIGAAFFGESMFSRPELGGTDASKICLVHLIRHLRRRGFVLLDTQFTNPHMEQFGPVEIPRREYLKRLKVAVGREAAWGELKV